MPCSPHTHHIPPQLPQWEPALTELRDLSPAALDALITRWLVAQHFAAVRRCERQAHETTYQALLGTPPFGIPVRIRVYQRRNRLQVHHVDAFAGYLIRVGVPVGMLITTGRTSRQAMLAVGSTQAPRVRLITGPDWAAELAGRKPGIELQRLWGWVLHLPSHLPKTKRSRCTRRSR